MTKSIYDQLNASGTVAKQRIVETFSGDALDTDRWELRSISGVTGAMADSVDGGYILTAGSGGNDRGEISFNDIGQFNLAGSVMIAVSKISSISNVNSWVGLLKARAQNASYGYIGNISTLSSTKLSLTTHDGSTSSTSFSTNNMDTDWHTRKLIFSTSGVQGYIDGVLEVDKSTNKPTGNAQPEVWVNGAGAPSTHSVSYMEVYNT